MSYEQILERITALASDETNPSPNPTMIRYLLLHQLDEQVDLAVRALDLAERHGITPLLNPNPASEFPLLWYRGDPAPVARVVTPPFTRGHAPTITITGARAATGYGEHVAMEIASGVATSTVYGAPPVVLSGGSYGVDGMAHRATMAVGGQTVAVLGGGLDKLYPSGHDQLLTRVAESPGCALLSAVAPGTVPSRGRFLARNRLLAELSDVVVIVEAGPRSGSLTTANHAIRLGKVGQVGAVPGPVTSTASHGTNALLDGTAFPVHSAQSVIDKLLYLFSTPSTTERTRTAGVI